MWWAVIFLFYGGNNFIFSLPWYSNPGAGTVRVDGAGGVRNHLGGLGGLEGKDVVIRGVGDALAHTDGRLLTRGFVLGDKSEGKIKCSQYSLQSCDEARLGITRDLRDLREFYLEHRALSLEKLNIPHPD